MLAVVCTGVRADDSVHWYSSIEEASAHALANNRPLMIDFRADWCKPCKVMEQEVYTTASFRQAAQNWSLVQIDFDKNSGLAHKYRVDGLPAIVFADSYGNSLFEHEGYIGAAPLLALAAALPVDVSEFNRLGKILTEDKNNFEALTAMGKALRTAGLYRTSSEYYLKASQRPEAKSMPEARESIFNEIGLNYLDVRDANLAAPVFELCLKEFRNSPRKRAWTLSLGRSYSFGDKKQRDKAKRVLEGLTREFPSSPESELARQILASL